MRPRSRPFRVLNFILMGVMFAPAAAGRAVAASSPARLAEAHPPAAAPPNETEIQALLLPRPDIAALKEIGPGVLPVMARIYERSDEPARATIAYAFYSLGWKSPEAKRALMKDVHTESRDLRLQVQWALGRVSNDADVVDVLLANMQNDDNPLFRDKAACALASDQIHLTEGQKLQLYGRLIEALRDPKPQVRDIALKVLQEQTGQTKGFDPNAPPAEREAQISAWEQWLQEYRANQ